MAGGSYSHKTSLNVAMVADLIDRQSNAIAQIVFFESVEFEMRRLGWSNETLANASDSGTEGKMKLAYQQKLDINTDYR